LCFLIINSAYLMLVSTNPINSVVFLIVIFFSISILFIFLNADFIGIIILIIYIGAIAVLFLFIVMLTNIKRLEKETTVYLIIGIMLLIVLFFQLSFIFMGIFLDYLEVHIFSNELLFFEANNIDEYNKKYILFYIGYILFFKSPYLVIYSALLMLSTIVGAIYITNFKNGFSMRKQYNEQLWRTNKVYVFNSY
jgi:NADH-quinone oxidoreductase subunit J